MSEQQLRTDSRIERLLNRIAILDANDAASNKRPLTEGRTHLSEALPYTIVLSAAALRAEGLSVSPEAEQRVVESLGVTRGMWINSFIDMHNTLEVGAPEVAYGDHLSVALDEESLEAVRKRPPFGFYPVHAMVTLAARQETALHEQANIVLHNMAVQAQL